MADYAERARSNYFRVKDKGAFRIFLEHFDDVCLIEKEDRVGFIADSGIPLTFVVDDDTGEEDHADFVVELAGHLADHEVAIIQNVGHERMRYLVGHATAINNKLEQVDIDLLDIYQMADALTDTPDRITRAEYEGEESGRA